MGRGGGGGGRGGWGLRLDGGIQKKEPTSPENNHLPVSK